MQQAIDIVKERLSKYLKRTDDSDKSYDNGYCKALDHTLEDLQALGDGWILSSEKLPEEGMCILMYVEYSDQSSNIILDRYYVKNTRWRNDDDVRVKKWKEIIPPKI